MKEALMKFGVISLFPDIFKSQLVGLVGQAQKKGLFDVSVQNPRDFASGVHQAVDDEPYGGGDGMLLKADLLKSSLQSLKSQKGFEKAQVVYLSPQGPLWNQKMAKGWAQEQSPKILICGRYAGLDERFIKEHCDQELSIGNYILNGGELAALVVMESVVRLLQGTLGNEVSTDFDSLSSENLLEAPQYTRPRVWEGLEVPATLLSGNHQKISRWKAYMSLLQTAYKRRDLLDEQATKDLKKLLSLGRQGQGCLPKTESEIDELAQLCLNDFGWERVKAIQNFLKDPS